MLFFWKLTSKIRDFFKMDAFCPEGFDRLIGGAYA